MLQKTFSIEDWANRKELFRVFTIPDAAGGTYMTVVSLPESVRAGLAEFSEKDREMIKAEILTAISLTFDNLEDGSGQPLEVLN